MIPAVLLAALLGGAMALPTTAGDPPAATGAAAFRELPRAVLEDRIRGGWAGQMFGVAFAAKHEFVSNGAILRGPLDWSPEMVANALDQDDLYVEMTFAKVMDGQGIDATAAQYAAAFRDSEYRLWHANARARLALRNGIEPPWSGHPRYNPHANDIDFQIEADFIGLMAPGLPQATNRLADRIGHIMNYGDGVYGGMFVAAMYAAAFFEHDPRRLVETALRSLPAESGYAQAIAHVLDIHARQPRDWEAAWEEITARWDRDDADDEGSLRPFNIDARLNGAYVVLGLLYGGGDMTRTLEIATHAGQDADCNAATAAGVLGTILGYAAIPAEWTAGIPAIAHRKFAYTTYSFEDIVASTLSRARALVEAEGGHAGGDTWLVPVQDPVPAPLEQWHPGAPVREHLFDDPAWQWRGEWHADERQRSSDQPGAEAELAFEGTGLMLVGRLAQDGGRADVYLDGEPAGTLDAYIPERTSDRALWWHEGLVPGPHRLRIVLRDDADPDAQGRRLNIERAVIYDAGASGTAAVAPAPLAR